MTVQAEKHEYSVVREEKETEKNEFGTHETIKGYDSKGRLVMIRQSSELLDGGRSHFFKSVSAEGYWEGGFGNEDKDGNHFGGILAREPFEDN